MKQDQAVKANLPLFGNDKLSQEKSFPFILRSLFQDCNSSSILIFGFPLGKLLSKRSIRYPSLEEKVNCRNNIAFF